MFHLDAYNNWPCGPDLQHRLIWSGAWWNLTHPSFNLQKSKVMNRTIEASERSYDEHRQGQRNAGDAQAELLV